MSHLEPASVNIRGSSTWLLLGYILAYSSKCCAACCHFSLVTFSFSVFYRSPARSVNHMLPLIISQLLRVGPSPTACLMVRPFFFLQINNKERMKKNKKMTVSKWLWSQIITDQFVWTCLWRTHVSLISRLCFLCRHFEAVLQRPQRHKCPDPADVHRNCLVDGQTCEVQEPCRHQLKPHGCFSRYRQSATSAALSLSLRERLSVFLIADKS